MRFAHVGWLSITLSAAVLVAVGDAGQDRKDDKKDADVIVINIVGKGAKAKYVKDGADKDTPVEVKVGQKVRWVNKSNVLHTAYYKVKDQTIFDTGDIEKDEKSPDIAFDQKLYESVGGTPGGEVTIKYKCATHGGMQGTLILKAAVKDEKDK